MCLRTFNLYNIINICFTIFSFEQFIFQSLKQYIISSPRSTAWSTITYIKGEDGGDEVTPLTSS